jgi:hypothetical protein
MRLYSYIVRYDIGFAPNPFHGWCTLATCKPQIRGSASIGDWIVGTGSKAKNLEGKLVYATRVEERLTFDDYWNDPRFQAKKPDVHGSLKYRYGDNIYHRTHEGAWEQADSRHSREGGLQNLAHVARDTGRNVVIASQHFTYWGGQAPEIPGRFRDWNGADICVRGVGYQWRTISQEMRVASVEWIESLGQGYHGDPADW